MPLPSPSDFHSSYLWRYRSQLWIFMWRLWLQSHVISIKSDKVLFWIQGRSCLSFTNFHFQRLMKGFVYSPFVKSTRRHTLFYHLRILKLCYLQEINPFVRRQNQLGFYKCEKKIRKTMIKLIGKQEQKSLLAKFINSAPWEMARCLTLGVVCCPQTISPTMRSSPMIE